MRSMFRMVDDYENHSDQQIEVRVCRTKGCGLDAEERDAFCPKCREEIDAMHDMARCRVIIHGIHSAPGTHSASRANRRGRRRLSLARS